MINEKLITKLYVSDYYLFIRYFSSKYYKKVTLYHQYCTSSYLVVNKINKLIYSDSITGLGLEYC